MRLRRFLPLLAGAAMSLIWSPLARAQQSAMPMVGLLQGRSAEMAAHLVPNSIQQLADEVIE